MARISRSKNFAEGQSQSFQFWRIDAFGNELTTPCTCNSSVCQVSMRMRLPEWPSRRWYMYVAPTFTVKYGRTKLSRVKFSRFVSGLQKPRNLYSSKCYGYNMVCALYQYNFWKMNSSGVYKWHDYYITYVMSCSAMQLTLVLKLPCTTYQVPRTSF